VILIFGTYVRIMFSPRRGEPEVSQLALLARGIGICRGAVYRAV
jgi:hypothetical protein